MLLDTLPAAECKRLSPHLELIMLSSGEILCEPGRKLCYAYFPTTCIVSLLNVMADGATTGVAVAGSEGFIGVTLFMEGDAMPELAVVQSAGYAYRLRKRLLMEEFGRYGGRRKGALHHLMLRYIRALMLQTEQMLACTRHHSVDQQICLWLLLYLDRLSGNELALTQEMIARMLGVRREGITEAAGKLQRAGLIHYSRGHITVLDRRGLEAQVCECYQLVRTEFDCLIDSFHSMMR
ncbi:MAG: Crp/Fnr family transcriptional regulator [Nitrosomonas sp.]|nr:Crp/Fnr family transcriptional regulator [Nitrosomonas sp.]MDP1951533.1 Crp/Fnr family transcriptional regulator [Nitrosomonas sp.]